MKNDLGIEVRYEKVPVTEIRIGHVIHLNGYDVKVIGIKWLTAQLIEFDTVQTFDLDGNDQFAFHEDEKIHKEVPA